MGNTSNPIINRVGSIQPWANHYVPSKLLKFQLKLVNLTLKILKNYISYSNSFKFNIFVHNFWYKNVNFSYKLSSQNYAQFFKRFYYSNSTLGIEHSFLIRNSTSEFFDFKPWVMQYNKWLVVIICWFKPPKQFKPAPNESFDENVLVKVTKKRKRHILKSSSNLSRLTLYQF